MKCCCGTPMMPRRADHRHRVEHARVLSTAVLDRMARLGIIGVPQQHFIYRTGDGYLANLGPERAPWCYPQKAYLDRGMVLAGSSDRPVVPGAPLAGIHDAVNQMTSGGRPLRPRRGDNARSRPSPHTRWGRPTAASRNGSRAPWWRASWRTLLCWTATRRPSTPRPLARLGCWEPSWAGGSSTRPTGSVPRIDMVKRSKGKPILLFSCL